MQGDMKSIFCRKYMRHREKDISGNTARKKLLKGDDPCQRRSEDCKCPKEVHRMEIPEVLQAMMEPAAGMVPKIGQGEMLK